MSILDNAMPCPFCGSLGLRITDWWDDDGEYDAIECCRCKAAAPADAWNRRAETVPNTYQAGAD